MQEPGKVIETIEKSGKLPEGDDERFTGYGLMGVPFRSGHVLCLRRFPVTSIGRGYTSVWHRDPGGCWTLIQDVPPAEWVLALFRQCRGQIPRAGYPAIAQLNAWTLRLSKTLDFHTLFVCCKNPHFNLLIILCLIKLSIMLAILLTRTIISSKAMDHPASTITE